MPRRSWMARSSSRMRSRSWASRLDSGSSNSSTFGWVTTARASATRCCWPPESREGERSAYWASAMVSSMVSTRSFISAFGRLSRRTPYSTFSRTVMCGKRA